MIMWQDITSYTITNTFPTVGFDEICVGAGTFMFVRLARMEANYERRRQMRLNVHRP